MARPIVTALLGAALCVVGGAFDTASLYLPGVTLVLAAGIGTAWVLLAATGATVVRAPVPATVVEGEPFAVHAEARLPWLGAPAGELTDPLSQARAPIAGRRRVRLDAEVTLPRRGPLALAPSVLTVRDPLGVCSRRTLGQAGAEVLVLPRVDPVTAVGQDGAGGGAGRGTGFGSGAGTAGPWHDDASDGLDLDGLRAYREGAPASRIHWATLARRGEMMERRFVAERASAALVVLDASEPADAAALDAAVRAAASLCVALARSEGVALLLPGDRRPIEIGHDLGAWPAAHKRLALVEAGVRPVLGGLTQSPSTLFWVTGADPAGLPRDLHRLSSQARYLVAPRLPGGNEASFEVGGCAGAMMDRGRAKATA